MNVGMFSHDGILYQGEATSFNVKTRAGEITILDHHHPIITILKKGKAVIIKKGGVLAEFDIEAGFLEMNAHNELTVLVHEAHGKNS